MLEKNFKSEKKNKTESISIASSTLNFSIELVKKIGYDDLPELIIISDHLVKEYTQNVRLTKTSIKKYFNYPNTLPFILKKSDMIIGYIIGVPLEYFSNDPSFQNDDNLGKENTLYTYAFVILEKYKENGYAKTLKRVYISWARKKGFKFVSGHIQEGISEKFKYEVEILQKFNNWHGTNKIFEYYRRLI